MASCTGTTREASFCNQLLLRQVVNIPALGHLAYFSTTQNQRQVNNSMIFFKLVFSEQV